MRPRFAIARPCDARRRALRPELGRLHPDVDRTIHLSGGVPVLRGEDRAAAQTCRVDGIPFRPIPR